MNNDKYKVAISENVRLLHSYLRLWLRREEKYFRMKRKER